MARRKRPPLPSLQSNPPAKRCWDRHSAKWNGPYPSARPIRVEGMSHEDADAEQDTRCRDDLAHSFPPCLTGESSTGSFPDDFVESGKWFRRPGQAARDGPVLLDATRERLRFPDHPFAFFLARMGRRATALISRNGLAATAGGRL